MKKQKKFLVFGSPRIEGPEITDVVSSLKSGWIGTGPKVTRFEGMFRHYKKVKHAQALNSCTAALHLSLLAAGIGKGDEVITTAMTFCATVNAIIHSRATPVLADCDPSTFNIDPQKIEKAITKRTRAILPVHFAGRPCDMTSIMRIARKHKLLVIEDCAHAIETAYKGQKAGTFGDIGCFSFYVTKNITTGEGGMAITDNKNYADRIKILGLHGMSQDAWKRFSDKGYKHYKVISIGYKYNMTDIQAALGIHQLARIDSYWKIRKKIWHRYNDAFKDLPVQLPAPEEANTRHAYHLYTILIDTRRVGISRDEFLAAMNRAKIGVGVHYLSIPEHPFYQKTFGWKLKNYPNAWRIGQRTVSLPISAKLSHYDVDNVIKTVKNIFQNA